MDQSVSDIVTGGNVSFVRGNAVDPLHVAYFSIPLDNLCSILCFHGVAARMRGCYFWVSSSGCVECCREVLFAIGSIIRR